jgi:hypothetical protein
MQAGEEYIKSSLEAKPITIQSIKQSMSRSSLVQ